MVMIRMRAPSGTGKVILGDGSAVTVNSDGLFDCDSQWQPSLELGGCSTSLGGSPASRPFPGSGCPSQPRMGDEYYNSQTSLITVFDSAAAWWKTAAGALDPLKGQAKYGYPTQSGLLVCI